MKKVVGISLLVLVVLIFGVLPGVMGILAQRATVAAINAPTPNNYPVSFQLLSYQRHWFSSDVIYTVTLKSLAANANTAQTQNGAMPTGIMVTEKVYHGPVVFTSNLDSAWRVYVGQAVAKGVLTSSPTGTSFQRFFPNATVTPAGQFRELTTLGLMGRLRVIVATPMLTMNSTTSANVVKISPVRIYASANRGMKKFGFGLDIPALSMTSQGQPVFTLNGWKLQAKLRKSPEQLLLGWANLQINDVTAGLANGRHADLQNFVMSAKSDVMNKLLNSDSQINFARLTIDNKQFGPGVMKLSFKRFDPKAQAELARLNSYASPQTPWAQAAMMREASRLFSKLIAHGAQVVVSPVNVKTSDGDVNASLSLVFPNIKKGQHLSLPMQLHATNANFSLTLPKVLAHRAIDATNRRQIQLQVGAGLTPNGATNIDAMVTAQRTNQVNNWLSRGFVVSRGDNYTIDLSYKQGSVYLNGKDFKQLFGAPTSVTTVMSSTGGAMPAATAMTPGAAVMTPAPVAVSTAPVNATSVTTTTTTAVPAATTPTVTSTAPAVSSAAPAVTTSVVPTAASVMSQPADTAVTTVVSSSNQPLPAPAATGTTGN